MKEYAEETADERYAAECRKRDGITGG